MDPSALPRLDVRDPGREKLASDLIQALRYLHLSHDQPQADVAALAAQAFDKLQYDLPLVNDAEVQALCQAFRQALDSKHRLFPYQLTPKFLANVIEGAQKADPTVYHRDSPVQTKHSGLLPQRCGAVSAHQVPLATTAIPAAKPNAGFGDACVLNPSLLPTSGCSTASYQQLCACILLNFTAYALSLPEHDAWFLLYQLRSKGNSPAEPAATTALSPDETGCQHIIASNTGAQQVDRAAHASMGNELSGSHSFVAYHDVEAAQPDDDSTVYEDLDPAPTHSAELKHNIPTTVSMLTHSDPEYTWQQLHHVLLQLACNIQYSMLCADVLWSPPTVPTCLAASSKDNNSNQNPDAAYQSCSNFLGSPALSGVLHLLRVVGSHAHAQQLQPLSSACTALVTAHICAKPSALPMMDAVMDELGIASIATMPQKARPVKAASGSTWPPDSSHVDPALPYEAVLAVSIINNLASSLPDGASKAALWRRVHTQLLPALDRCLSELVSAPDSSDNFAAVMMLSQVLEFYIEYRPGSVDLPHALLNKSGIVRSICLLHVKFGGEPAAEPLRLAALLAAASSAQVFSWMTAVPDFNKSLAGPSFQEQGCADILGALWEVLSPRSTDNNRVLKLLQGLSDPDHVPVICSTVQLLVRLNRASDKRPLWGVKLIGVFSDLLAEVRRCISSKHALAQDGNTRTTPCDCPSSADDIRKAASDPQLLANRRAMRLLPNLLKDLKQLLLESSGSGKVD